VKHWNVLTPSQHGTLVVNRNDNTIGLMLSATGDWEPALRSLVEALIRRAWPEGSAIDIVDGGANLGIHSLAWARLRGYRTRVFAIEAQRLVYQQLNANLALNSIGNVWTYHRLLSDRHDETLRLQCPDPTRPANFGAYEALPPHAGSDFDGRHYLAAEPVSTLTIDALPLAECALIKLDVEGMEDRALAGAMSTLERCRPIVLFERHKTDYEAVRARLLSLDYSLWGLPDHDVLAMRREWDGLMSSLGEGDA
jgi:FkbM family methyltransferase